MGVRLSKTFAKAHACIGGLKSPAAGGETGAPARIRVAANNGVRDYLFWNTRRGARATLPRVEGRTIDP